MPESNLDFAKIAANPTPSTWSQAYSAGNLYAVLSLEKEEKEEEKVEEERIEEKDFLAILGKSILDTLESEYFALETKDLDSIKNAILITAHKIPDNIKSSFVITSLVKNILYIFILGIGKIHLKRDGNFGLILQSTSNEKTTIRAASGYVKEGDVIILETKQFSDIIPSEKLASTLDNLSPDEIVESIAPTVHGHEQGGAAAIIINFKETPSVEIEEKEEEKEEDKTLEEKVLEEAPIKTTSSSVGILNRITHFLTSVFRKINFKKPSLNHSKKLYLFIAILVLIVLVFSIFLAIKKQNEAKVKSMFDGVYPQAVQKYEEGQSLIDLNQNLARDSFNSSKKIINENLEKFTKDSNEQKQLLELLTKVENAINSTSGVNTVEAKEIEKDKSEFLSFILSSKAIAFGQDDDTIYSIDKDGIYSTTKGKENTKEIVENDNDWSSPISVIPYLSNIYVLDKTEGGVIKFVGGSSGFGKANYFTDTKPDLTDAKSMAIDGSIWILLSDGTVTKYTRGKSDGFSLTGLDSSFSNPTKIYTNSDLDNIYILDNGNSRIVVFDKEGNYKEQYSASVLSNAKEIDVLEGDKKVLILSSDKVYEININ